MSLWTGTEAARATGGTLTADFTAQGVAIDTRELQPGDLFVALRGENADGHAYVARALQLGAAAALVDQPLTAEGPLLRVADTQAGLEALGRAARARATAMKALAVTGSVGKTSTKEMLRAMLVEQAAVAAAVRSFNNHWGVPLTLARTPRETRFGVYEIGMNHPGEITPLTRMVRPDVAIITTIAPVHLAAFATGVRGIADAKAEIFAGMGADGIAVLNADNDWFDHLAMRAREAGVGRIISFGTGPSAEARLLSARVAKGMLVCEAEIAGQGFVFKLAVPARHFALNALAALAAAQAAGADLARAVLGLATWQAPQGRGDRWRVQLRDGGSITLLDDSYNANPASMAAAIAALAETPVGRAASGRDGRRLAFLTDMLELGPDELRLHADLAKVAEIGTIDRVHVAGTRMRALHESLAADRRGLWAEQADGLAAEVGKLVRDGDVVMVKGSNGSRAGRIAAAIKALGVATPLTAGEN